MNIHNIPNKIPNKLSNNGARKVSPAINKGLGVVSVNGVSDFSGVLGSALEATESASSIEKLKALEKGDKKDDAGLRDATREFEAYFVNMLLKQVRKTLSDGGLTEKSEARKNFESMLDQEYAKLLSEGEGIGLGKAMYEAMKKSYF